MKYVILILLLLPSLTCQLYGQFLGSDDDGYATAARASEFGPQFPEVYGASADDGYAFALTSAAYSPAELAALFLGSSDDGYASAGADIMTIIAELTALYRGSADDGYTTARANLMENIAGLSALYRGSVDDGYTSEKADLNMIINVLGALYRGSVDDGYASAATFLELVALEQALLFRGGIDDGYATAAAALELMGPELAALFRGSVDDGYATGGVSVMLMSAELAALFRGSTDDGYASATTAVALPLALISFEAIPHEKFVLLKWVTENEVDTDFFTIERTTDGVAYTEVGTTLAAGFTEPGEQPHYELPDDSPLPGTSYYRVRTTDFDGTFQLSGLREVFYEDAAAEWDFRLFPNPGDGRTVNVEPVGFAGDAALSVYDVAGRLLQQSVVVGGAITPVDFRRKLAAGSYVVRLMVGGSVRSKLIIVR
ncbi:T9SS type A sorting domain-containing protein [Neolewinella antarctica]|uniref:T9SS type A sorting domain-containing protein n=1 Tax=Neolewinella antarctica TaxID=442734 RepID=A0ABX0XHP3_9BACT|nr:T9SS type A sorting domain-containing protein [Neolewinella antarctica]NJC28349.1 hypothetical protein [Neolewinella antarctica]